MTRGWWWALPGAAVLFGLAAAFGAADVPRRVVGVGLLLGGVALAWWLQRTRRWPDVRGGRVPVLGGAAAAFAVLATASSFLLEAGTWWTSVLAAAFALLVGGVGFLACWCLASTEAAGPEERAWRSTSTRTSG